MKIIVSPDSFKGSCSAMQAAKTIEEAIRSLNDTVELVTIPVADGGEGTVDVIAGCTVSTIHEVMVCGPMGEPIPARYVMLDDSKMAVIEMAQASGLTLVAESNRNPMVATSYGTGQLIRDALDSGCKKLIIGIGGSATNDGGVGALMALGASFKDAKGEEISLGAAAVAEIAFIDLENLDQRLFETELIVACDVTNPLTGEHGASRVYGPQKGATPEMVEALDRALFHFAGLSAAKLGRDFSICPGAGAAGGMGFALMAFCNAEFVSGIDIILDICGFERELKEASLVITGEGKIDGQSLYGKVLYGIGMRAKAYNIPVIAFGGSVMPDSEKLLDYGITAMFSIENQPMTLDYAMKNSEELLKNSVKNVMRFYTFLSSSSQNLR